MLTFLLAMLLLAALAVFAERLGWPWELFAHFRPHILAALALTLVVALILGEWVHGVLALGIAAALAITFPAVKFIRPDGYLPPEGALTILWANVWRRTDAALRTIDFARSRGVDIVLATESQTIDMEDPAFTTGFPHRFEVGVRNPAGRLVNRIAVFSRYPIASATTDRDPSFGNRPFAILDVLIADGRTLRIVAIHAANPARPPPRLAYRNRLIQGIAPHARRPFLLAGDFNATPWSMGYRPAPGTRIGNPLLESTWFTRWPLLGLPIDHLHVSPELRVHTYEVGPFLGSDHRALLTTVSLRGDA